MGRWHGGPSNLTETLRCADGGRARRQLRTGPIIGSPGTGRLDFASRLCRRVRHCERPSPTPPAGCCRWTRRRLRTAKSSSKTASLRKSARAATPAAGMPRLRRGRAAAGPGQRAHASGIHGPARVPGRRAVLPLDPRPDWRPRRTSTRDDWLWSARLGALECVAGGVTTIGDNTDAGVTMPVAVESGLRGIIYPGTVRH